MTLLKHIITCLYYLFIPRSYSQLGEDLVILNHLERLGKNIKSPGFYVDIGAFHPLDGSNTYKLYRNGSSGVVIDFMTSSSRPSISIFITDQLASLACFDEKENSINSLICRALTFCVF